MRKAQIRAYEHMLRCVENTPVTDIHYDRNGCVYTLEDGRSYYFDPNKSAGWLYTVPYTGLFEEKETGYVRRTIQADWVCFDIGACFGWYSVLFSQLAGEGQVHAFEPVSDNRACLEANLTLNNCSNVKINSFALGEKQSRTKIYIPNDGVSGSFKAHARLDKCNVFEVDVSTLDQYFREARINRLDFIKADIEGAEFLMLKGAEDTLRVYRPIMMLEVQAHSTRLFGYEPEDLFHWLKNIGYSVYYVNSDCELIPYDDQLNKTYLPDYNFIFKFDDI
jgi:FkbM family methyltransferase